MAMHIGQAELSALVAESQFFMIDPTKMKYGRLHVMNMYPPLGNIPAKFIGLPID